MMLVATCFMRMNANAQTAYIANDGDSTVSVINVVTNMVTTTIPIGSIPFGVSVYDSCRLFLPTGFINLHSFLRINHE